MTEFTQQFLLDNLPADVVIRLCLVSTTMMNFCPGYLQTRARRELKNSNIVINSIQDYIRILSLSKEDFVVTGSEAFITLDEAVYRAVISNDRMLINYFLRRSPEAEMGCKSRQVRLVAYVAMLNNNTNILQDIISDCGDTILRPGWKLGSKGGVTLREYLQILADVLKGDKNNLFSEGWIRLDVEGVIGEITSYNSVSLAKIILKRFPDLGNVLPIPAWLLNNAARLGNLELVEYLVTTYLEATYTTQYGIAYPVLDFNRALASAIEEGHLPVVGYFAKTVPDFNLDNLLGRVIGSRYSEVIDYLISQGAKLDFSDARDLFFEAVHNGSWNKVRYLIENGYIALKDVYLALHEEDLEGVRELINIDPRLDLNKILVGEVDRKFPEVIEFLLSRGARNERALMKARSLKNWPIVRLLESYRR